VGADVVLAGGVITHQPRLAADLASRLAVTDPDLTITVLRVPPVHGAIRLAEELASQRAGGPDDPRRAETGRYENPATAPSVHTSSSAAPTEMPQPTTPEKEV
jgi:hypothetical protein